MTVDLRELAIDRSGTRHGSLRTRRHVLTRYVLPLMLSPDSQAMKISIAGRQTVNINMLLRDIRLPLIRPVLSRL